MSIIYFIQMYLTLTAVQHCVCIYILYKYIYSHIQYIISICTLSQPFRELSLVINMRVPSLQNLRSDSLRTDVGDLQASALPQPSAIFIKPWDVEWYRIHPYSQTDSIFGNEIYTVGAIYSFQTRFEYVHSKQFKGGHGANSETYYGTSFLLVHFLS